MITRAHVIFKGRVQGVFFRANTAEMARSCSVNGWVRNLRDGSVEAVFEGDKAHIEEVIEWCRTSQPYAQVENAEVLWQEATGEFMDFDIRH